MSRYPAIDFDRLQMYFRHPYIIDLEELDGIITVLQPSLGDLVRIGEKKFFGTLNIFISNTTSYRLILWRLGFDWNEMSDFQMFCIFCKLVDPEVAHLFFEDIDFKNLIFDESKECLRDEYSGIEINEEAYQHFHQYLQAMFNIYPEEKITSDKTMKSWFIKKDERELHNAEATEEKTSSSMLALISSCVNHPGFKYRASELEAIGVCEFYDSVKRLQIYENTTALLKGMCSGFVDSKKINPEDYNFMKEL